MRNKVCGIYVITNTINNKQYIGSSKDVGTRFRKHLSRLRNNTHPNQHLQNAVNKYKLINFTFSLLEETTLDDLLTREQYYLDLLEWDNLYNLSKIANSGGGDTVRKPLILLNLKGDIVDTFESGTDVADFLNRKLLDYASINTPSIKNKKYRIVTPEFYRDQLSVIKTWRTYSNQSLHDKLTIKLEVYELEKNGEKTRFFTKKEVAAQLGISSQRVSQIYQRIDNQNLNKYFHKNTGYFIQYVKKN